VLSTISVEKPVENPGLSGRKALRFADFWLFAHILFKPVTRP